MKTAIHSLLCSLLIVGSVHCQRDTSEINKNLFHVALGGGMSTRPFVDLQYSQYYKRMIGFSVSFNYMKIDAPSPSPQLIQNYSGDHESLKLVSLCFIKMVGLKPRLTSTFEGGITYGGNTHAEIGLNLKASMLYSFGKSVGIRSFILFNVNGTQPFVGAGASLCLGRLKPNA